MVDREVAAQETGPKLPRGFGVIWTTVAIDLVGFGIVLPILPQYAERFGVGAAFIGVLSASFSLAQLLFAPVWGGLSDRFGRKPILLVSLFGTAVGSLLTGVAGSIWILFLGRILDGVSGASVSVAQAAVGDVSPPSQRARLMGLLGAAFGVGFVIGPAIGALAALGGPHVPFFIAAAIAAVNGVIAIRRLPETAKGVAGHPLADPEVVAARAEEFAAFEAVAAARGDAGAAPASTAAAGIDAERIAAEPGLDGPGIVEPAHLAGPGRRSPTPARSTGPRSCGSSSWPSWPWSPSAGSRPRSRCSPRSGSGSPWPPPRRCSPPSASCWWWCRAVCVHPVTSRLGEGGTLRFGLVANAVGLGLLAVDLGWAGSGAWRCSASPSGRACLAPDALVGRVRPGRPPAGPVARVAAVGRRPGPGDRADRGRLAVRVHRHRCALRAGRGAGAGGAHPGADRIRRRPAPPASRPTTGPSRVAPGWFRT